MLKNEYRPEFGNRPGETGVVQVLGEEEAFRTHSSCYPNKTRCNNWRIVTERSPGASSVINLVHRNAPGVDVIVVAGLSLAETGDRVSHLPDHTHCLHGAIFLRCRRPEHPYFGPDGIAGRKANAPMFNSYTIGFGSGVVGGPLVNIEHASEVIGDELAQVLKGTPTSQLPVKTVGYVREADWRELKKWGIAESRLPPGTEVRFRQFSVWEQYRWPLLAILGGILAQALAIGFLLAERRRRSVADRAASASEELSRAILSSLSSRVAILDRDGSIIRVSENWGTSNPAEDRFPQAAIGANYLESWRVWQRRGDAGEGVVTAVSAVLGGKKKNRLLDYPIQIGEQNRWVEVRVERLDRPEGGAVVKHADITPQKQSEMDLRRSIDELHHMNRVASVGQLAGSLAHELAQPLASILSNAQAGMRFAERPQPDIVEIRGAFGEIATDDRRARTIIDRLRAILKKEAIPLQEIELNQVVEEVRRLVSNILLMRRISLHVEPAAGGVMVHADQISLQQVLLNLLNNAMDAMEDLPMERRVLTVSTGTSNGAGEIVVDDNGPGIPIRSRTGCSTLSSPPSARGWGWGFLFAGRSSSR